MNPLITVVMPTYNRPECIRYYIENSVKKYNGELFCFEIHDSSENELTKNYVHEANQCLKLSIKYHRYDSSINGDDKTHKALSNVKTDYFYLIGDGFAPDFNRLEKMLLENNFPKYDLVGLFFRDRNKNVNSKFKQNDKIYEENDISYIFENLTLFLTLYGASICSTKMFSFINENKLFEKFNFHGRYSFAYCLSLIEALIAGNFKFGVSFTKINPNPNKKGNWAHDENFYKIFYEEFITDLDKVSHFSTEDKNKALKRIGAYHFTYRGIVRYKMLGVFKPRYLKKYKKYVKRCNNHYWFMKLVAFLPKWLCCAFYHLLKGCKRLVHNKSN